MLLTEKKAKNKWCRQSRVTKTAGGKNRLPKENNAFYRLADILPKNCLCIASECMGWRWAGKSHDLIQPEGHHDGGIPYGEKRIPVGYCGDAGVPIELLKETNQFTLSDLSDKTINELFDRLSNVPKIKVKGGG